MKEWEGEKFTRSPPTYRFFLFVHCTACWEGGRGVCDFYDSIILDRDGKGRKKYMVHGTHLFFSVIIICTLIQTLNGLKCYSLSLGRSVGQRTKNNVCGVRRKKWERVKQVVPEMLATIALIGESTQKKV
mmetsp:Transcript_25679/g.59656  ORF Transcript_25679/g.59656 Transcript_25679/m.59656 type:complete len:130 (-) Transcript_25679:373-762(-)